MYVTDALKEVRKEYVRAVKCFPKFASAHEGYAIIYEEMDELWNDVKKQYTINRTDNMRQEAIQVAAMALRFLTDIC